MRFPAAHVALALRARQRGVSLVAVSIGLSVLAIVMSGLATLQINAAQVKAGEIYGHTVNQVAAAVTQYRGTNLTALTSAAPAVAGFADAMAPTVAELRAQGYLNAAVATVLPDGNSYAVRIQKTPAACVGPSATCSVWSQLSLNNPIVESDGQPNARMLSAMMSAIKEPSSYSAAPNPAVIVGGNGGWTVPNPDATSREGIFVVVAGLGGPGAPWLYVGDPRNPNFTGPSVTGVQFDTVIKVAGAACAPQGAFASGPNGVMYCNAGVWQLYSAPIVAAGAACTAEGAMGATVAGASLICVNALWRDHLTFGIRGAAYYAHNTVVPRPTCGSGLTATAVVSAVSSSVIIGGNNPGNNTGSYQANIDPTSWLVTIVGSDNSQAGLNSRALILTFCNV